MAIQSPLVEGDRRPMAKRGQDSESDWVDAAFNRVLAAEARAREEVEACRAEAARLLAAAEDRSRRITGRADRRVRRAHRIADAGVERALAELRAVGVEREPDGLSEQTLSRLDRVIDALVTEILAPGSGSEP